jgi:predicted transcriptional regulator
VTDRDVVVEVVALGKNPADISLDRLAHQREVITVGADDSVQEAIQMMKNHKVRRLLVIDGTEVGGMVSVAGIARQVWQPQVADLLSAVSS